MIEYIKAAIDSAISDVLRNFLFFIYKKISTGRKKKMPQKTKKTAKKVCEDKILIIPPESIDLRRLYATYALEEQDHLLFFCNLVAYFQKKRRQPSVELEFLLAREDCPKEFRTDLTSLLESFLNYIKAFADSTKSTRKEKKEKPMLNPDRRLTSKVIALERKFKEDKLFRNLVDNAIILKILPKTAIPKTKKLKLWRARDGLL
jgi:hypothetical protein